MAGRAFSGGHKGSASCAMLRQEIVARQLGELIAERPVPGQLRVLDVGCGQGTQALRLADAGHEVTGLDPHLLRERHAGRRSRG
jgi:2-polyprenyl-3-methyl-5-hydroxy-6-metoxy-1,4-benzoquinol methylase